MGQNGRASDGDTPDHGSSHPRSTVRTRPSAPSGECDPGELFGEATMTAPPVTE